MDVGVLALDAGGKINVTNQQQKHDQALLHPDPATGEAPEQARFYGGGGKELLAPEMLPEGRAATGEDFSDYLVWVGETGKQRVFSISARAIRNGDRFDGSVMTRRQPPRE